jgi:hypothetical protein
MEYGYGVSPGMNTIFTSGEGYYFLFNLLLERQGFYRLNPINDERR